MNRTFISIIAVLFVALISTGKTTDYSYLKIALSDQETISYPPGTGFLAQDAEGKTILNPEDLERLKVYEVVSPITLFVFVSWKDEPDVYELKTGKLVLGKTDRTYKVATDDKSKKSSKDHFSRPTDGNYTDDTKLDKSKNHNVYLLKAKYFSYDEETGHDMSLEFSNGIVFYYKDGKAVAWEDGRLLKMTGKYMIQIPTGYLKISYDPFTKKMWWCTSKN